MSRRKRTLCRAAKGVIPYSRKPYWKRVDKEGGGGRCEWACKEGRQVAVLVLDARITRGWMHDGVCEWRWGWRRWLVTRGRGGAAALSGN